MSDQDLEFWNRIRRARDKLAAQFINHPDVTLIDMGYPFDEAEASAEIVLRIHVRTGGTKTDPKEKTVFPSEFDGFPVVVMPGDYDFGDNSLPTEAV